jgi:hypothetical protein
VLTQQSGKALTRRAHIAAPRGALRPQQSCLGRLRRLLHRQRQRCFGCSQITALQRLLAHFERVVLVFSHIGKSRCIGIFKTAKRLHAQVSKLQKIIFHEFIIRNIYESFNAYQRHGMFDGSNNKAGEHLAASTSLVAQPKLGPSRRTHQVAETVNAVSINSCAAPRL